MEKREIVRIVGLRKSYVSGEGKVHAVRGIDLTINEGEFYTLLGPSGCGKTTTLRSVAGLERIDGGEIIINGQVVAGPRRFVPPYERPIGMVFQSYAIWPHMTVADNVAFPLKNRKKGCSPKEISRAVDRVLSLVRLEGLGKRPAPNLSGGQQQRLALARALVADPALLLLDEPLSNLDAKLREEMRLELKSLVRRLGITTLYVTHDQLEALALSDRIAVMRDGEIIDEGNPYDLYMFPKYSFTAGFFGVNNILEARITNVDTALGIAQVDAGLGHPITVAGASAHVAPDQATAIAVRPENITLELGRQPSQSASSSLNGLNRLGGVVAEVVFLGDYVDYKISVRGIPLRVRTHPDIRIEPQTEVTIGFASTRVRMLQDSRREHRADFSSQKEVLSRV